MHESHIITLLKDGTPLPDSEPQHDYMDDPNFEDYENRADYYIDFMADGIYKFGPHVSGTYKIEGNKVSTSTPQDDIVFEYSVEDNNLTLEGIRHYDDVDLDITYKLRRNL